MKNILRNFSKKVIFQLKTFIQLQLILSFSHCYLKLKSYIKAFQIEYPDQEDYFKSIFNELMPFYALKYNGNGKLFPFKHKIPNNLPRLILAHHVHNADCEKLFDKMVINKLIIWDIEKLIFNISSSSSKPEIVRKERENCLTLGYNYYRIHARQHLKAGNQNRSIPNAIDGIDKEYYLTLDDDYFIFPNYALMEHERLVSEQLDYIQSPLVFKGIYDQVTMGEKADAESMLFFELTLGRNYPRNYVFPRGTGTIFQFQDGKNSLSDTGGFLVDFSSEDFGQGYLAMVKEYSTVFGKKESKLNPGIITENIYVIGEGVDLTGKLKQIERWMQGAGQIFFHIMIPVLFKALLNREIRLLRKKQFISIFFLTSIGITFRYMLFLFLTLPFLLLLYRDYILHDILNYSWFLLIIFLSGILTNFYMYFYKLGKVSWNSAIRLFLIEPLITLHASIGYFKGLFGKKPKLWVANKSKQGSFRNFYGIYFLILINLIPIFGFYKNKIEINFWPFINLLLLISGYVLFRKIQSPQDSIPKSIRRISLNKWIYLCIFSLFIWSIFFGLELSGILNPLKILIMSIMIFNSYIAFRMMGYNIVLFKKQINKQQKLIKINQLIVYETN